MTKMEHTIKGKDTQMPRTTWRTGTSEKKQQLVPLWCPLIISWKSPAGLPSSPVGTHRWPTSTSFQNSQVQSATRITLFKYTNNVLWDWHYFLKYLSSSVWIWEYSINIVSPTKHCCGSQYSPTSLTRHSIIRQTRYYDTIFVNQTS